jgi:hypothetical protein
MKKTTYPKISKELRAIYKKYFDSGADPSYGIELIDQFLINYPYYTEAILFKARMLIAMDKFKEAAKYINLIKILDEWSTSYIYDEAELLSHHDENIAIDYICQKLKLIIDSMSAGIRDFLIATNPDKRNEYKKKICADLIKYAKEKTVRK